jgi:hypothetical protein
MLKKLVAVIAAAVMVLAMGVTAFADNESPTTPIIGDKGFAVVGQFVETGDAATDALCEAINAGAATIADIPGVTLPANAEAISGVFDVRPEGNVTFPVQAVLPVENPAQYSAIYALHYSTVKNAWEMINADAIGTDSATFTFSDLSPVILVGVKASGKPTPGPGPSPAPSGKGGQSGQGGKTSPATGSNTNAAVYAVLAGVLAVAAAGFAMRKRNA